MKGALTTNMKYMHKWNIYERNENFPLWVCVSAYVYFCVCVRVSGGCAAGRMCTYILYLQDRHPNAVYWRSVTSPLRSAHLVHVDKSFPVAKHTALTVWSTVNPMTVTQTPRATFPIRISTFFYESTYLSLFSIVSYERHVGYKRIPYSDKLYTHTNSVILILLTVFSLPTLPFIVTKLVAASYWLRPFGVTTIFKSEV